MSRSVPPLSARPSAQLSDALERGVVPTSRGVVLIAVPGAGEDRLEALRREGVPRLLLLATDELAPLDADPLEDWVRLPAADADVDLRVQLLEGRAACDPHLHRTRCGGSR